uniref:Uncharacterized protein n=1 Tax=Nelumbo nucifera TaxID=4432 RepID=A0A822YYF0_NELNU|nr:TPA_asm: hypothetical protein HUJ06_008208 [Nelumbo nucifera]
MIKAGTLFVYEVGSVDTTFIAARGVATKVIQRSSPEE